MCICIRICIYVLHIHVYKFVTNFVGAALVALYNVFILISIYM